MSHAFCITAYADFEQLSALLSLLSPSYACFVHIDAKSAVPEAFLRQWSGHPQVFLHSSQRILWGSYRHVLAVMELLRAAQQKGPYTFYHIISENTFPICTQSEFEDFFNAQPGRNFLELTRSAAQDPQAKRTRYFYFQHLYNARSRTGYRIERVLLAGQRFLHVRRSFRPEYKGYLYCHLSREFVGWLFDNDSLWRKYLRQLKYCYAGEEYFFQNLLMQSPFAPTAQNDPLIYDLWDDPDRGLPAVLDARDLPMLQSSGKLFARKFSSACKQPTEYFSQAFHSQ